MADGAAASPVELWQSAPPGWLDRTHRTSDLGYPGFHPPRPGQEEDLLTDKYIRDGFSSTSNVAAETFSALNHAKEAISDSSLFGQIEDIATRVLARRNERLNEVPHWSFKLPGRAAFNDKRRLSWIKDLADPDIPLPKLGRSVPSGIKGHELLEMLSTNDVSMPRALWYIRVLGGNDTQQGIRSRVNQDNSQYSIEWTCTLTSYTRKLLSEITLPSPPRQGLNIRQSFKNTFADPETSEQWTRKCSYIFDLINICYSEGLIDSHTFLSWLAGQADSAVTNSAQLIFIARFAEEYVEGLAHSRIYSRPFLKDYLERLEEVINNPQVTQMPLSLEAMKQLLLQFMLINPETLICAEIWRHHSPLIEDIILEHELHSPQLGIAEIFREIKRRNEGLLLQDPFDIRSNSWDPQRNDFQSLCSLSRDNPPSQVCHFTDESPFRRKLEILLAWSVSNGVPGHHRIYATASLLSQWLDRRSRESSGIHRTDIVLELHDMLFEWLDNLPLYQSRISPREVPRLFGELIRRQLFSYDRYIQRLVSRGDNLACVDIEMPPHNEVQPPLSPHAQYVRDIPLIKPDHALERQRKSVLYGHRSRQSEEEKIESDIRKEVTSVIPYFFSEHIRSSTIYSKEKLRDCCPQLLACSPYVQVRIWRGLVTPAVHSRIHTPLCQSAYSSSDYRILFELLNMTRSYVVLFEIIVRIFLSVNQNILLELCIEQIVRLSDILFCMNGELTLCSAISASAPRWRAHGVDLRSLLPLIEHLHLHRYLSPGTYDTLKEVTPPLMRGPRTELDHQNPPTAFMDDLLGLARGSEPGDGTVLALTICEAYGISSNLTWMIWESILLSMKRISELSPEDRFREECLGRYVDFMECIASHHPTSMTSEAQDWLQDVGPREWPTITAAAFELFALYLKKLLSRGVIQSHVILTGFLCVVWKSAALDSMIDSARKLSSSIWLAYPILLCAEEAPSLCPLGEFQCLASQRTNALRGDSLLCLVDTLPSLVRLEYDAGLDSAVRKSISILRLHLTDSHAFKQSLLREAAGFRDVFLFALKRDSPDAVTASQIARAGKYALQLVSDDPDLPSHTDNPDLHDYFHFLFSLRIQLTLLEFTDAADESAEEEIDAFVYSFFTPTLEQAKGLLDVGPGAKGLLREKFLDHGLRRLTAFMESSNLRTCSSQEVFTTIDNMSRILHVTCRFTEPWSISESMASVEVSDLQGHLWALLMLDLPWLLEQSVIMDDVEALREPSIPVAARRGAMLYMRLIHLSLALMPQDPSPETQQNLRHIRNLLVTSMVTFNAGFDPQLFTLVFDTASYVTDALTSETQRSEDHSHLFEESQIYDIPISVRQEDRERIKFLLGSNITIAGAPELAAVPGGGSEDQVFRIPSRPWESLDRGEIQSDPQDPSSRNTGSVAFEHFEAKFSCTNLMQGHEDDSNLKWLLDSTSANSPFERDWSEARLGSIRRPMAIISEVEAYGEDLERFTQPTPILRSSPTPSGLSLFSGSARTSSSWKASPTPGLSSMSTEFSNSSNTGSQNKRKKSPHEEGLNKQNRMSKNSKSSRRH